MRVLLFFSFGLTDVTFFLPIIEGELTEKVDRCEESMDKEDDEEPLLLLFLELARIRNLVIFDEADCEAIEGMVLVG